MDERRVDMVRLESEERYYDREALLGRDTSSVFPSLARQQAEAGAAAGGLDVDAIKEALGARKFISESELETIRATRGVTADDGAVAVDKPLAEILRERKAAKEAEHAEKWRLMKVGKNRPLDAEELGFLDSVAAAEAERERAWQSMEQAELEAYKAAVRERSAEPEAAGPAGRPAEAGPAAKPQRADPRLPAAAGAAISGAAAKPVLRAVVKVKPKATAAGAQGTAAAAGASANGKEALDAAADAPNTKAATTTTGASEPPCKRAKTGQEQQEGTAAEEESGAKAGSASAQAAGQGEGRGGGGGLLGLIGEYGSDSDGVEE